MTDAAGPSSLAKKLAEIVLEVSSVAKRGRNEFHKYDYVLESDVLWALREPLAKRNIVIIPEILKSSDTRDITGKSSTSTVTQVEMMLHVTDADSGEKLSLPWTGIGMDTGDKGIYKAITGGYKYFLMKLFMLASGDDPEGDEKSDRVASEGRSKKIKMPERVSSARDMDDYARGVVETPVAKESGLADASPGLGGGVESPPSYETLTPAEVKGLWVAIRAAGVTEGTFRAMLQGMGYASSKEIPKSVLPDILKVVNEGEEVVKMYVRTLFTEDAK